MVQERDAVRAIERAVETQSTVTLDQVREAVSEHSAQPKLSKDERDRAAAAVKRAAAETLEAEGQSREEAEAAVDAALTPSPFDVLDPCRPGKVEPPKYLIDGLIYDGRSHELFGRPGSNKSMLVVWLLAALAAEGVDVLLIEYEMDDSAIGLWLEEMGYDRESLRPYFHQINPTQPFGHAVLDAAVERFPEARAVALDNVAEAIRSTGGDENSAGETLRVLAPLRDLAHRPGGPAVLTIDHLPHSREDASRGSTAKGALIDVAYRVETPHPVTRERAGDIKLTCKKDRPSRIGVGSEIWHTVGDGQGALPIKRIATPGKIEGELTDDGATMIVRLEAHAADHPGNPWCSKEKVYTVAGLAKSRKRDAQLAMLAADPTYPIEQRERDRGNAPTVTEYRWAAVDDDDALGI